MENPVPEARRRWLLPALVAGAVASHAAVLAIRGASLLSQWRDVITEGAEGPHVYALWRLLHGQPLYEAADAPPFSLTFYNWLFYRSYAAVLGWVGVDGEGLLLGGRVVTVGWTVVGAWAWTGWVRALGGWGRGTHRGMLAGLAFLTWFGSNFASWWTLSIRPDLPAMALVACGLWAATEATERDDAGRMALASLAFAAAWYFKQSVGASGAGVGLYLLATRRWRLSAALALPMAAVVGTSLGLGSEAYRYNLLVAPRLSRLDLAQAVDILVRTVPQNALAWGVGAWGAWSGARGEQGGRAAGRAVAAGAAVALLLGLLGIARAGGNRNHLFEAYLLLSGAAAVEVLRAEGRARAVFAGAVGLVAAFALVQLAVPNRFGTLTLDGRWRAPLRAWLAERTATGGTLLVLDDVLAQPWSSSGGRHPAYVLDPVWLEVSGTGVRRTVAQVLAQPGVTGWVATESQLQALRGGAAGCAPLPPAAGAPGWFECPR